MARSGLALLMALPLVSAVATTPGNPCYDLLLSDGSTWVEGGGAGTCDTTAACTSSLLKRNEHTSAEACCRCGGGSKPYYVTHPSNMCVNDGKSAGQGPNVLTFGTKTECCNTLTRRERAACLDAPTTKAYPDYELGKCVAAHITKPVTYPACTVTATGAIKYISAKYMKKSLGSGPSGIMLDACCRRAYDGISQAAVNKCKAQRGSWSFVAPDGCVRELQSSYHPVEYSTQELASADMNTCATTHFSLALSYTCTVHACAGAAGLTNKANKGDIHCGTVVTDCTDELCCDVLCNHPTVVATRSCGDGFIDQLALPAICGDGTVDGCKDVFHEVCCDVSCYSFQCPAGQELLQAADNIRCDPNIQNSQAACAGTTCCVPTCTSYYDVATQCPGVTGDPDYLISVPAIPAPPSIAIGVDVRDLKVRPHWQNQYFGRAAKSVQLFDVTGTVALSTSGASTGDLQAYAVFPFGDRVVTAGADNVVTVWTVSPAGTWTDPVAYAVVANVISVAVMPDGRHFVTCAAGTNAITVWDSAVTTAAAKLGDIPYLTTDEAGNHPLQIVTLAKEAYLADPTKTYFAVHTAKNKEIKIFDFEGRVEAVSFVTGAGAAEDLLDFAVLSDGTFLTSSRNGVMRLHDSAGGLVRQFDTYDLSKATTESGLAEGELLAVSNTQHGAHFASGDSNGHVYLWDAAVATPMRKFARVTGGPAVLGVLATPQGWSSASHGYNLVVTVSDQTARVAPLSKQAGCTGGGGACVDGDCCAYTCTHHACLAGFADKADKDNIICGKNAGDCNTNLCCDVLCDHVGVCTDGWKLNPARAAVVCDGATATDPTGASCTKNLCCDSLCSHTSVKATCVDPGSVGYRAYAASAAMDAKICSAVIVAGVMVTASDFDCLDRCCASTCVHDNVKGAAGTCVGAAGYRAPTGTAADAKLCKEPTPGANVAFNCETLCCSSLCGHNSVKVGTGTCKAADGYAVPADTAADLKLCKDPRTTDGDATLFDCPTLCCASLCGHASVKVGTGTCKPADGYAVPDPLDTAADLKVCKKPRTTDGDATLFDCPTLCCASLCGHASVKVGTGTCKPADGYAVPDPLDTAADLKVCKKPRTTDGDATLFDCPTLCCASLCGHASVKVGTGTCKPADGYAVPDPLDTAADLKVCKKPRTTDGDATLFDCPTLCCASLCGHASVKVGTGTCKPADGYAVPDPLDTAADLKVCKKPRTTDGDATLFDCPTLCCASLCGHASVKVGTGTCKPADGYAVPDPLDTAADLKVCKKPRTTDGDATLFDCPTLCCASLCGHASVKVGTGTCKPADGYAVPDPLDTAADLKVCKKPRTTDGDATLFDCPTLCCASLCGHASVKVGTGTCKPADGYAVPDPLDTAADLKVCKKPRTTDGDATLFDCPTLCCASLCGHASVKVGTGTCKPADGYAVPDPLDTAADLKVCKKPRTTDGDATLFDCPTLCCASLCGHASVKVGTGTCKPADGYAVPDPLDTAADLKVCKKPRTTDGDATLFDCPTLCCASLCGHASVKVGTGTCKAADGYAVPDPLDTAADLKVCKKPRTTDGDATLFDCPTLCCASLCGHASVKVGTGTCKAADGYAVPDPLDTAADLKVCKKPQTTDGDATLFDCPTLCCASLCGHASVKVGTGTCKPADGYAVPDPLDTAADLKVCKKPRTTDGDATLFDCPTLCCASLCGHASVKVGTGTCKPADGYAVPDPLDTAADLKVCKKPRTTDGDATLFDCPTLCCASLCGHASVKVGTGTCKPADGYAVPDPLDTAADLKVCKKPRTTDGDATLFDCPTLCCASLCGHASVKVGTGTCKPADGYAVPDPLDTAADLKVCKKPRTTDGDATLFDCPTLCCASLCGHASVKVGTGTCKPADGYAVPDPLDTAADLKVCKKPRTTDGDATLFDCPTLCCASLCGHASVKVGTGTCKPADGYAVPDPLDTAADLKVCKKPRTTDGDATLFDCPTLCCASLCGHASVKVGTGTCKPADGYAVPDPLDTAADLKVCKKPRTTDGDATLFDCPTLCCASLCGHASVKVGTGTCKAADGYAVPDPLDTAADLKVCKKPRTTDGDATLFDCPTLCCASLCGHASVKVGTGTCKAADGYAVPDPLDTAADLKVCKKPRTTDGDATLFDCPTLCCASLCGHASVKVGTGTCKAADGYAVPDPLDTAADLKVCKKPRTTDGDATLFDCPTLCCASLCGHASVKVGTGTCKAADGYAVPDPLDTAADLKVCKKPRTTDGDATLFDCPTLCCASLCGHASVKVGTGTCKPADGYAVPDPLDTAADLKVCKKPRTTDGDATLFDCPTLCCASLCGHASVKVGTGTCKPADGYAVPDPLDTAADLKVCKKPRTTDGDATLFDCPTLCCASLCGHASVKVGTGTCKPADGYAVPDPLDTAADLKVCKKPRTTDGDATLFDCPTLCCASLCGHASVKVGTGTCKPADGYAVPDPLDTAADLKVCKKPRTTDGDATLFDCPTLCCASLCGHASVKVGTGTCKAADGYAVPDPLDTAADLKVCKKPRTTDGDATLFDCPTLCCASLCGHASVKVGTGTCKAADGYAVPDPLDTAADLKVCKKPRTTDGDATLFDCPTLCCASLCGHASVKVGTGTCKPADGYAVPDPLDTAADLKVCKKPQTTDGDATLFDCPTLCCASLCGHASVKVGTGTCKPADGYAVPDPLDTAADLKVCKKPRTTDGDATLFDCPTLCCASLCGHASVKVGTGTCKAADGYAVPDPLDTAADLKVCKKPRTTDGDATLFDCPTLCCASLCGHASVKVGTGTCKAADGYAVPDPLDTAADLKVCKKPRTTDGDATLFDCPTLCCASLCGHASVKVGTGTCKAADGYAVPDPLDTAADLKVCKKPRTTDGDATLFDCPTLCCASLCGHASVKVGTGTCKAADGYAVPDPLDTAADLKVCKKPQTTDGAATLFDCPTLCCASLCGHASVKVGTGTCKAADGYVVPDPLDTAADLKVCKKPQTTDGAATLFDCQTLCCSILCDATGVQAACAVVDEYVALTIGPELTAHENKVCNVPAASGATSVECRNRCCRLRCGNPAITFTPTCVSAILTSTTCGDAPGAGAADVLDPTTCTNAVCCP